MAKTYEDIKAKYEGTSLGSVNGTPDLIDEYDPDTERLVASFEMYTRHSPLMGFDAVPIDTPDPLLANEVCDVNELRKIIMVPFPERYPIEDARRFFELEAWTAFGMTMLILLKEGTNKVIGIDDFNDLVCVDATAPLIEATAPIIIEMALMGSPAPLVLEDLIG